MTRIKDITIAAIVNGGLVAGGLGLAPANAAPLAQGFVAVAGEPAATTVAYGCGRGYAPGLYGVCRPIYGRYAYAPGRAYVYGGSRYGVGVPVLRVGPYGAGLSFY